MEPPGKREHALSKEPKGTVLFGPLLYKSKKEQRRKNASLFLFNKRGPNRTVPFGSFYSLLANISLTFGQ